MGTKLFSDLITFTRASSATRVNSSGLVETVASDQPRFDYDPVTLQPKGLLIEEQRTNLLLNSLLDGSALPTQTVAVTAQAYTLSFYGAGTVTLSGVYTAVVSGNGVYPARTTLNFTPLAGSLVCTVSGTVQFAQLEAGAFPTSCIPTTTAAATRAADAATITGANFSSWYRQDEGTFMCSWRIQDTTSQTDSQHQLIRVNTSGTNPTIALRLGYNAGRRMRGYAQDGSAVFQYAVDAPVTAATIGSTAIAYSSSNDFALCDSGGTVSKNTSGNISSFSVNQMQIGAGIGVLNGWVSRVAYYPRRLTDAELQALTA